MTCPPAAISAPVARWRVHGKAPHDLWQLASGTLVCSQCDKRYKGTLEDQRRRFCRGFCPGAAAARLPEATRYLEEQRAFQERGAVHQVVELAPVCAPSRKRLRLAIARSNEMAPFIHPPDFVMKEGQLADLRVVRKGEPPPAPTRAKLSWHQDEGCFRMQATESSCQGVVHKPDPESRLEVRRQDHSVIFGTVFSVKFDTVSDAVACFRAATLRNAVPPGPDGGSNSVSGAPGAEAQGVPTPGLLVGKRPPPKRAPPRGGLSKKARMAQQSMAAAVESGPASEEAARPKRDRPDEAGQGAECSQAAKRAAVSAALDDAEMDLIESTPATPSESALAVAPEGAEAGDPQTGLAAGFMPVEAPEAAEGFTPTASPVHEPDPESGGQMSDGAAQPMLVRPLGSEESSDLVDARPSKVPRLEGVAAAGGPVDPSEALPRGRGEVSRHVDPPVAADGMNTEHVQDDIDNEQGDGASSSSNALPAASESALARGPPRAVVVPSSLEERLAPAFGEKWRDAIDKTHSIWWAAPILYCSKCFQYSGSQKTLLRGELSKVCGEKPPNAYRKKRIQEGNHPDGFRCKDVVLGRPQRIL